MASATAPTGKRSRSTDPGLPIKRPRTAKLRRGGTESVDTPKAKLNGESPRSAGPVRSAKSFGSDGMSRFSTRSSKSTRSDGSTPLSGSARTPTTQGTAGGKRSASQPRSKQAQKLPASVPSLSDTESFGSSEEDTLAALSGSRSSLRRRGSSSNAKPSARIGACPNSSGFPQSQVRISSSFE